MKHIRIQLCSIALVLGGAAAAFADDAPGDRTAEAPQAPDQADAEPESPPQADPGTTIAQVPAPVAAAAAEPPRDADADKELQERLRETEKRLDEVETRSLLQRIQWSGDYRSVVSSYRYHGPSPDGARNPDFSPVIVDSTNEEQWLNRLRFNLRADPTSSVRFTGRLTMFKRFGTNAATLFPQDSTETQIPRDSGVRLERAWLDWFITPYFAISAGRISYSNGPPAELRENLAESDATWGLHMVDGEFDTVDVTLTAGERLLARGFYASWAFPLESDLFSEHLFLNNGTDNMRIVGGNIDVRTPELGNHFVQLGFYGVPQFRPFTVPIPNPMPPDNPTNQPAPFDGSLVFPSAKPSSLGSYYNLSALMLWKDIGGSGLDMFGSVSYGRLNPNGRAIEYPIGPMGESVPFLGLASADSDEHDTLLVYTGARFTLPMGKRAPRIGFEYNFGSKYWISFTSPGTDLINKLSNRGHAFEGYYIQPINEYLFLRAGVTHLETNFLGGFFGPLDPMVGGTAPAVDQNLTAYNLLINAEF